MTLGLVIFSIGHKHFSLPVCISKNIKEKINKSDIKQLWGRISHDSLVIVILPNGLGRVIDFKKYIYIYNTYNSIFPA